ncbi:MAG: hypothetical protein D6797_06560 [Bdellovibrio sp.]|nr:MAG: hypothetical protein D6797_06560 [Bdellovibrio sp.]
MLKVLKKQKGVSLVEALTALGIVSVSIMGALKGMESLGKVSAQKRKTNVVDNKIKEIKMYLSNPEICKKVFTRQTQVIRKKGRTRTVIGPVVLDLKRFKPRGVVIPRYIYDKASATFVENTENPVLAASGVEVSSGVKIKRVSFQPLVALDNVKTVGTVLVAFHISGASGGRDIYRKIPVFIKRDSRNRVQECSAVEMSMVMDMSDEDYNNICRLGNPYMSYDPKTGKCTKTLKEQWFTGTSDKASCPPGTRLANPFNPWVSCRIPGVKCPDKGVAPTYNAFPGKTPPNFWKGPGCAKPQIDINNQACDCLYLNEVVYPDGRIVSIADQVTKGQCQVKCIVPQSP